MIKKILLLLVIVSGISIAQSISFTPILVTGVYLVDGIEVGKVGPTWSWELVVDVPITKHVSISPYVYRYRGRYTESGVSLYNYNEKSWYLGMTFTYSFK